MTDAPDDDDANDWSNVNDTPPNTGSTRPRTLLDLPWPTDLTFVGLAGVPAVYVFDGLDPLLPLYVGSSVDVGRRFREHRHKAWMPFASSVSVFYGGMDEASARRLEKELIQALNPVCNVQRRFR